MLSSNTDLCVCDDYAEQSREREKERKKAREGMMKRDERRSAGEEEVERNKDINNVFSQRDDPWPSRGIWFIWLSG